MRAFLLACIVLLMSSCSLMKMGSETIKIKKDKYRIVAKYPKLQSPDNLKLVQRFVMRQISNFQETYGTDEDHDLYRFKIKYKVSESDTYKSIIFRVALYEAKELKNFFYKTFVFNKDTEKRVFLADILDTELKELVVAQVLREELQKQIPLEYFDKDRVFRATNPRGSELKNFYFHKDELHVLFNPLEIAPLEAGSFDVLVSI